MDLLAHKINAEILGENEIYIEKINEFDKVEIIKKNECM